MFINILFNTLRGKLLLGLVISLFLYGCDSSDKKNKKDLSLQQTVKKYTKEAVLKGLVSNKNKPLSSGAIKATDTKGKTIATAELDNDNHYKITIPADTELPLILSFNPDNDNSEKSKLISVVIYASIKKYDINDLTTLIAKKAKSLGGYTHRNMVIAADGTVGIPDANKTSTGFRGDPTKQYGGWH